MLRRFALAVAASALFALVVTEAWAVQRTFVASYGLTANTAFNCSLVKPCRAFSEAIGLTNPGGEVVVLDSAGYGPVTITQSVSIVAPAGVHAGISVFPGFDGVLINAPDANIVLRGLSINGQGGSIGISVISALRVRIENCVIAGMNSHGVSHTGDGTQVFITDTIIRDNQGSGVRMISKNGSINLDHVRSESNIQHGFFGGPTSDAIDASAVIVDSFIAGNSMDGVNVATGGAAKYVINVSRTTMSHNAGSGFRAVAGVTLGAYVRANLGSNTVHRNGVYGVSFFAPTFVGGGYVHGRLFENIVQENPTTDFYGEGDVFMYAGSNVIGHIDCNSSPYPPFRSYGNNEVDSFGAVCKLALLLE